MEGSFMVDGLLDGRSPEGAARRIPGSAFPHSMRATPCGSAVPGAIADAANRGETPLLQSAEDFSFGNSQHPQNYTSLTDIGKHHQLDRVGN
jgi:hypothetical protein